MVTELKRKSNVFAKLPPGSIRILILEPGTAQDDLHGTFEVCNLDEDPEYQAVSYAWGEAIFDQVLYLPNGTLRLTSSLAGGLRRFRDSFDCMKLWADAICINQQDMEERNQQVAIMGGIFSRAQNVLVWLGESGTSDSQNFWMLDLLSTADQHRAYDRVSGRRLLHQGMRDFYEARQKGISCPQSCACCSEPFDYQQRSYQEALLSLSAFFGRPWFRRLWVVQEICLGFDVQFYCGNHSISLAKLKDAVITFWDEVDNVITKGLMSPTNRQMQLLQDTRSQARLVMSTLETQQLVADQSLHAAFFLLDVWRRTSDLQCLETLDRIYAVMGICHADTELGLEPDYRKLPEQLWLDVATAILTTASSWTLDRDGTRTPQNSPALIMAIGASQCSDRPRKLRSWVPDFSNLSKEDERKFDTYDHRDPDATAGGYFGVSSAPHTNSTGDLCFNGKFVNCLVCICQDSQWPGAPRPGQRDFHEFTERILVPWYLRCKIFMADRCRQPLAKEDVTDILLHGQTYRRGTPIPYQHFLGLFRNALSRGSFPISFSDAETAYQELGVLLSDQFWDADTIDRRQVLAATTDNRICWVPEGSRVNDSVALLGGTPFPWILRPNADGCFSVIGDAHVQGVMRGEEWPESAFYGLNKEEGDTLHERLQTEPYLRERLLLRDPSSIGDSSGGPNASDPLEEIRLV